MSKKNTSKIILDVFHHHEALDRLYLIMGLIDNHLLEHPVIKEYKMLNNRTEKALELLTEAYNIVGGLEFTKFNNIKDNENVDKIKNGTRRVTRPRRKE